jgi:hypothetical protein
MIMRRSAVLLYCIVLAGCAGIAPGAPEPAPWSWEIVRSGAPNFASKNNADLVVVGVRFRNELRTDQVLVLARSDFLASTPDGNPVSVAGLLFSSQSAREVKQMSGVGNRETAEMLFEIRGSMRYPFVTTPGPVEIVIGAQQSYVQGLLLDRPEGHSGARLRFGSLPELEIELPDVPPTQ